jgi:hypothetical protein
MAGKSTTLDEITIASASAKPKIVATYLVLSAESMLQLTPNKLLLLHTSNCFHVLVLH